MRDKVILVDADGVMLDWAYSFTAWMSRHGYEEVRKDVYCMAQRYGMDREKINFLIRVFNESSAIYNLPPHRDAIKYIQKLHREHGFIFHCISSLSDEYTAQYLRTKNLKNLFGDTVFEKFIYLDTGADKDHVLEQYRDTGCVWVEDKDKNADLGVELGLDSLLMYHDFNRDYKGDAKIVRDWSEVYDHIMGI